MYIVQSFKLESSLFIYNVILASEKIDQIKSYKIDQYKQNEMSVHNKDILNSYFIFTEYFHRQSPLTLAIIQIIFHDTKIAFHISQSKH